MSAKCRIKGVLIGVVFLTALMVGRANTQPVISNVNKPIEKIAEFRANGKEDTPYNYQGTWTPIAKAGLQDQSVTTVGRNEKGTHISGEMIIKGTDFLLEGKVNVSSVIISQNTFPCQGEVHLQYVSGQIFRTEVTWERRENYIVAYYRNPQGDINRNEQIAATLIQDGKLSGTIRSMILIEGQRLFPFNGLVKNDSNKKDTTSRILPEGVPKGAIEGGRLFLPFNGMAKNDSDKKDTASNTEELLPPFKEELQGANVVRVFNPNDFQVTAGIRQDQRGKNLKVPANGVNFVLVPDGKYEIFFVYSNKPDALFKGDDFILYGHGVEIQIVQVVDGNYGIRQVK